MSKKLAYFLQMSLPTGDSLKEIKDVLGDDWKESGVGMTRIIFCYNKDGEPEIPERLAEIISFQKLHSVEGKKALLPGWE